jgi:hypothetical protein
MLAAIRPPSCIIVHHRAMVALILSLVPRQEVIRAVCGRDSWVNEAITRGRTIATRRPPGARVA